MLEYGLWLIPGGEIAELAATKGLAKAALQLFAIKHGKAMLVSAGADLTAQMINGKGSIVNRIKDINVASTVSNALLLHPLVNSSIGAMVNISYNTISNGEILQISDPNLCKSIILNRYASYGGEGYLKEATSVTIVGKIDKATYLSAEKK